MAASTYRIEEITRRTGFTTRTIRFYVQRGLLPATEQRGVATVYSHEQFIRLLAITLLRTRERLRLAGVKRRLAAMSLAEIEAFVGPLAAMTEATAPVVAADEEEEDPSPSSSNPRTSVDSKGGGFVPWERAVLLPGLELAVRADAPSLAQRIAKEILEKYGAIRRTSEEAGG